MLHSNQQAVCCNNNSFSAYFRACSFNILALVTDLSGRWCCCHRVHAYQRRCLKCFPQSTWLIWACLRFLCDNVVKEDVAGGCDELGKSVVVVADSTFLLDLSIRHTSYTNPFVRLLICVKCAFFWSDNLVSYNWIVACELSVRPSCSCVLHFW